MRRAGEIDNVEETSNKNAAPGYRAADHTHPDYADQVVISQTNRTLSLFCCRFFWGRLASSCHLLYCPQWGEKRGLMHHARFNCCMSKEQ